MLLKKSIDFDQAHKKIGDNRRRLPKFLFEVVWAYCILAMVLGVKTMPPRG
jgi:hypothetical protein